MLVDADGHEYVDLLGDYTAGLFGHGERRVLDAVDRALRELASVGGVHPRETELARLMCERFGLERVRFTNSGTEANLMAITAARQFTGRSKVLVFHGGYHGGVLFFSDGIAPWNAPYEFVVAPYNDLAASSALIDEHADGLAAVLAEPMLGSGGCIPATPEFLGGVFEAARSVGAVCIADEVMTSRHGRAGLAALLGAAPDIRTFGKYIGGGFSFGAFGGAADLLDQFDGSQPGSIPHAGTFNNNVATMAAGCVVLGELYTADTAEAHTARGERFRADVADVIGRHRLPVERLRVRVDAGAARASGRSGRRRRVGPARPRAAGAPLPRALRARDLHGAARDGQPEPAAHGRPARRRACGAGRDARRAGRPRRVVLRV